MLCQVLQRKTEEANTATKRLKELLESRKTSSRETSGHNAPGIQVLVTLYQASNTKENSFINMSCLFVAMELD